MKISNQASLSSNMLIERTDGPYQPASESQDVTDKGIFDLCSHSQEYTES